ncbi:MAG: bis-aminopropyl spermidine synthase family protein, partial [Promethearchaeota archaeon]
MSGLNQFLELHKLLLSGDYLIEDEISFFDFMRVLKLLKSSRKLSGSLKKSNCNFSTVLGVLEFLRNVSIIDLNRKGQLRINNKEILNKIYKSPSKFKLKLKLLLSFNKKLIVYSTNKNSLLKLYTSNFKLSKTNFQLPCSIKTSLSRAMMIVKNTYFNSQNILFIGDDDLVSLVVKFLNPDLPITVIEIDGRITKLLKEIINKKNYNNFEVYNNDFKELTKPHDLANANYSIIHLDPPYEPKELSKFLNNLPIVFNEKMIQIYLNGTFDNESMNIINAFLVKNKLKIVNYYKS